MLIKFTVPGAPMGKGRPKFSRQGGFVKTYTPEKTANYETLVKWYCKEAMTCDMLKGPLAIDIIAYFAIPKSTSKVNVKKMLDGEIKPAKKPDWDNIGKIICDAVNNIAYADDAQIINGTVSKCYSDTPRVETTIREIINDTA